MLTIEAESKVAARVAMREAHDLALAPLPHHSQLQKADSIQTAPPVGQFLLLKSGSPQPQLQPTGSVQISKPSAWGSSHAALAEQEDRIAQNQDSPKVKRYLGLARGESHIPKQGGKGAVYVMDWDDCISNEKDLNRQVMLRALAVSGGNQHVELVKERFEKLKSGESAQAPAPHLALSAEEFSHLMIQIRRLAEACDVNLVNSLIPEAGEASRNKAIDIIFRNFTRQYRALNVNALSYRQHKDLPPVQQQFKPGMVQYLKKKRTEHNLIILNSNKGDNDLKHEVARLGLTPYFDHIQGVSCLTRSHPNTDAGSLAAAMPEALQKRLMSALKSTDGDELRQTLEAALPYAHPDVTSIHETVGSKSERVAQVLADLAISPETPLIAIGDRPHDAQQLEAVASTYTNLTGVVLNPGMKKEITAAQQTASFPIYHMQTIDDLASHPAFQNSQFS